MNDDVRELRRTFSETNEKLEILKINERRANEEVKTVKEELGGREEEVKQLRILLTRKDKLVEGYRGDLERLRSSFAGEESQEKDEAKQRLKREEGRRREAEEEGKRIADELEKCEREAKAKDAEVSRLAALVGQADLEKYDLQQVLAELGAVIEEGRGENERLKAERDDLAGRGDDADRKGREADQLREVLEMQRVEAGRRAKAVEGMWRVKLDKAEGERDEARMAKEKAGKEVRGRLKEGFFLLTPPVSNVVKTHAGGQGEGDEAGGG